MRNNSKIKVNSNRSFGIVFFFVFCPTLIFLSSISFIASFIFILSFLFYYIATISTKGFRDTLEIARTRRLFLYDLFQDKPEKVLADRFLRFEIDERMDRNGNIINKLDVGEVKQLANKLKKAKIDAVAITLIHSYANPIHERQIKNILTKIYIYNLVYFLFFSIHHSLYLYQI